MENDIHTTKELETNHIDTYDFASPVEKVEAIDLTLRHYFGTKEWSAMRSRRFPGLQPKP